MHYYALCVNKIPVGVLGASGYAGRELCALIARHPRFALAFATANEQRGADRARRRPRRHVHRHRTTRRSTTPRWCSAHCRTARRRSGSSARARPGARVVDLSRDLRPGNGVRRHRLWADGARRATRHRAAPTSSRTRAAIRRRSCSRSRRCSTRGLVAPGATIIANSASGVTGAGNSPKRELLFAEVAEDYRAYGVGNTHRHLNEMRATLAALGARRRSRLHAAPAAGRARHPLDDHGAAHASRSTIRSRRGATRTRASRSSKSSSEPPALQRRRAPQRRAHLRDAARRARARRRCS